MKRYYGIIDEDGFLSDTGTNRKKLEKEAREWGDGCDVVNITEGVFQYAREKTDDEPLYIDELKDEYDPEIGEDAFFLNLPHVTVAQLKWYIADLPDDAKIAVWDTDTRSSKFCVNLSMNGTSVQLETETWGRGSLKN